MTGDPLVWVTSQATVEESPVFVTAYPDFDGMEVIIEAALYFPFPDVATVRVYVVRGGYDVLAIGDEDVDNLEHYAREDHRFHEHLERLAEDGNYDELKAECERWTA